MCSSGASQLLQDFSPCILVIEDEAAIRDTIVIALQEEGYQVIAAADGQQALQIIRAAEMPETADVPAIDLIILDIMLPYINGLDLCRTIRQQGNSVSILILSARNSETDIVVGLEVGADDYLTKPFGIRELIARCRSLLRRQPQSPVLLPSQDVLRFQEIELEPQACRVRVHGKEINLSRKEFSLLKLFINHPRRVFSREQLLEQIWGIDFMGDSKTVDVHIRWLREKVEIDPSQPQYILTIRGFGYRLG